MFARRPLAKTCLSVYEWGQIMDVRLPELFQFLYQTRNTHFKRRRTADQTKCFDEVYQYHEDASQMSRLMVSEAIQRAEKVLADYLGYWPCKTYIECEEVPYINIMPKEEYNYYDRHLRHDFDCCGDHPERDNIYLLRTRYGNIQRVGIRTEQVVELNVPITTYASIPNSTIHDAWQATLTAPLPEGVLASDVNVYVALSELGNLPQDQWHIQPVDVQIDPATNIATISGSRFLTVRPNNWIGFDVEPLTLYDPTDTTTHIESIDVYVYVWNQATNGCVTGAFIRDKDCNDERQDACINIYNSRSGYFYAYPVEYIAPDPDNNIEEACNNIKFDNSCYPYKRLPDKVCISYESGCCAECDNCSNCPHISECKRMIAILATSYLTCFPCDCNCAGCGETLKRYSKPAHFDTETGLMPLQMTKGENVPASFGYTMGGLIAYDMAMKMKINKGIVLPA